MFDDRRWPEAEPFIIKHPEAAADYAIFNLQKMARSRTNDQER